MTLLRSALYQLILVAVVIPYSGLVLCTAPLPRLVRWRVIAGWPQFAFWLSRHLLRIDYEVHGREHIPAKPCVVVSKHRRRGKRSRTRRSFLRTCTCSSASCCGCRSSAGGSR